MAESGFQPLLLFSGSQSMTSWGAGRPNSGSSSYVQAAPLSTSFSVNNSWKNHRLIESAPAVRQCWCLRCSCPTYTLATSRRQHLTFTVALASPLDPCFCFSASIGFLTSQSWPHWCWQQVGRFLIRLVNLSCSSLSPGFGIPCRMTVITHQTSPGELTWCGSPMPSCPSLSWQGGSMDNPGRKCTGFSSWKALQSSGDLIKIQIPEPFSKPPESTGVCSGNLEECRMGTHFPGNAGAHPNLRATGVVRGCCLQAHTCRHWNRKLHQPQLFFLKRRKKGNS